MEPQRQQALWAIALENDQAAILTAQQGWHNVSGACRDYCGLQCGGTRMPSDIERIRQTIRTQQYRISTHANEEMSDDTLEAQDLEQIIRTGTITQRFTHDPRGTRYEVAGETTDGRQAAVVCRLLLSGVLLIITAYVQEEDVS